MLKKVFSHTAIYALSPRIPTLVRILILPIITRDLTTLDYGIFGIIMAYSGVIGALRELGLRVIYGNTFFKMSGHFEKVWRRLHGFTYLWGMVYVVILGVVIRVALPEIPMERMQWILFLVLLPELAFNPVNLMGNRYFQLSKRPLPVAAVSIVSGFTSIGVTLYTISVLKLGYFGWLIAGASASFISFLIYSYFMYFRLNMYPIFRINRQRMKRYFKVSFPLIPHYYASYLLNSSDKVVMDLYKIDVNQIGRYNIAATFGNYFDILSVAVNKAVAPFYLGMLQNNTGEDHRKIRDLTIAVFGVFLLGTFTVSLWLREIFELLIRNEELALSYPLGIILIMSYNYRPMYTGFSMYFIFHEHTNSLWKISMTAALMNLGLNTLLIPIMGYEIAAWTTFVSLMYMGYSGYAFQQFRSYTSLAYRPLIFLGLTIGATVLVYLLRDSAIPLKAGLSAVLIVAALLLIFVNRKRIL